MHINSFNHFRAIAILLIVAGHSFGVTGLEIDSIMEKVVVNLIQGGTALFVFISGFLFHYIFYPKFKYSKFVLGKIKNVLVPYLILGFLPVFLYVYMKKDVFGTYFLPNGDGLFFEYVIPALKYYASGRFLTAYWYIPFIMLVFISSPLHVYFIKVRLKYKLGVIVAMSIVSMVIHRPIANIFVLQSLIYYTPIYLIGITASIYRDKIYDYLNGKEVYMILLAIVIALLQVNVGVVGNYHKEAFEISSIDLMYIQKILLCFFFMILLNRFENYNNKYIHAIASTSFTVFFIHPFLIWFTVKLNLPFLNNNSWFIWCIYVVFVSLFCILVAKAFKKFIPKYSRYIIGY